MTTKQFKVLLFILFLVGLNAKSATINTTLYLNRGYLNTVNGTALPYYAFNTNTQYSSQSEVIRLTTADVLIIKVINTDSVVHGFDVKRYPNATKIINPKDSIIDTLQFNTQGVFIYYDSYQTPKYRYLGGAGMISVFNATTDRKFYWNIQEHQTAYNNLLIENKPVNWSMYTPDYFTINGYSFPDILNDTLSRVNGVVGDTMHIMIANTGQSIHSMHIHGFHGKIIYSSINGETGREKDTFPIKSMETVIIELVPDKIGFYSVHDHNLMGTTGGGLNLRGMVTLMQFFK